jgi:hypothetical protein
MKKLLLAVALVATLGFAPHREGAQVAIIEAEILRISHAGDPEPCIAYAIYDTATEIIHGVRLDNPTSHGCRLLVSTISGDTYTQHQVIACDPGQDKTTNFPPNRRISFDVAAFALKGDTQ